MKIVRRVDSELYHAAALVPVQMSWDYLLESPLQDVASLLSAGLAPSAPASSASSGIGDSRHDVVCTPLSLFSQLYNSERSTKSMCIM